MYLYAQPDGSLGLTPVVTNLTIAREVTEYGRMLAKTCAKCGEGHIHVDAGEVYPWPDQFGPPSFDRTTLNGHDIVWVERKLIFTEWTDVR